MSNKRVTLSWKQLYQKTRVELITFLILIIAVSLLLPWKALIGLASLLAGKILGVMIGIFFAHITRIVAFHYLDLSQMIEDHHWAGVVFLTGWYCTIIYAVAMGG